MYYLLKLELAAIIRKGTKVVSCDDLTWLPDNEVDIDYWGCLWNGEKIFRELSDEYEVGDVIGTDIYDISYSFFSFHDAALSDELYDSFEDMFEFDFVKQWKDFEQPIVFLMEINGYSTWTDYGEEWDIDHMSVSVLNDGCFNLLVSQVSKME